MNRVEQLMERRVLRAFISADQFMVVLERASRQETAAGGWTRGTPAPRPPQPARLTPFKRRMTRGSLNDTAGEVTDLPYVLVGLPDMDIMVGDTFIKELGHYEVKEIDQNRSVRTAALVDYYG